jgi:hypothetical protein
MKPPRKQDNGATRAERIAVWACYALAAGLFILGQSRLLKGDLALGGALAVVAVLAAGGGGV